MTIIFIIGFVQAFFICLILLNKKNKRLPDKILTLWIFVTGAPSTPLLFSSYQLLPEITSFTRFYSATTIGARPVSSFVRDFTFQRTSKN